VIGLVHGWPLAHNINNHIRVNAVRRPAWVILSKARMGLIDSGDNGDAASASFLEDSIASVILHVVLLVLQ